MILTAEAAITIKLQNSYQVAPTHTIFASSMFPKDSTYKLHSTVVGLSNSRGKVIDVQSNAINLYKQDISKALSCNYHYILTHQNPV